MLLELKKNRAIIFGLDLEYWLQIKEFQRELVFNKKEFEGKFELPIYGEGRKAAGFQKHRSQRIEGNQNSLAASALYFNGQLHSSSATQVLEFHSL